MHAAFGTSTLGLPSQCHSTRTLAHHAITRSQSRIKARSAPVAERALQAATLPGEIDIKLRSFIPAEAIKVMPFGVDTTALHVVPVIGGDGRSFSYDEGNSRVEIRMRLVTSSSPNITTSGSAASSAHANGSSESGTHSSSSHSTARSEEAGDGHAQHLQQQQAQQQQQRQHVRLDVVNRHIGTSYEYSPDDIEHVTGQPPWYHRLKSPGAPIVKGDTLDITDDHISAELVLGQAPSVVGAHISISAVNPLIKPAPLVPASNTNLIVWFDLVEGTYWLKGEHDSFPCCELYINGAPVHLHDPLQSGTGPSFLAGPMDVKLDTPRAPIPAWALSQPVAQ